MNVTKRFYLVFVYCCFCYIATAQNPRDYAAHVTIARDKYGVPHIYGQTDADVAYGLAWAHSEDDFKTIEEALLMTKGLNGLANGKDGAITDFFVHAMGIKALVDSKYETDISPEFKLYLDGYAAGLNAYAATHKKEVRIPKAFPVCGKDLIQGYVLQMVLISYAHKPIEKIIKGKFDQMVTKGSNAFALSAPKSESGNTMLCVNPHVAFEGLFSWYEAHLKSDEGLDLLGALFPGGVTIFLGTNQNLGWAHTWNGLKLTDVYRLKMNPDKKNQYWFDGKWEDLQTGKAKLRVKLKKWLPRIPVGKKLYWSKFGPTFKSKNGEFYSIRVAANMDIKAAEQWYRMGKAANKEEFMTAVKMNSIIRFNLIYADKVGNISYIDDGMIPQRNNNLNWEQPVRGDTSLYLWTTWYPTDSLPSVHNPGCGWVYNTNNTPYDATCKEENIPFGKFSPNMGFRTGNNNRSTRFKELMNEHDKVSFDEMKSIKFDISYPAGSEFIVSVLKQLDISCSKPELEELRKRMINWDRKAAPESTEATLFMVTIAYIFDKKDYDDNSFLGSIVIEKELMEEALQYTYNHLMAHFGSTNVPISQLQRVRRGSLDLPMPGFPDALAANYSKQDKETGRYYGYVGDTYTMLVEYGPKGPIRIETLSVYGSSARPDSPHYNDQMRLFSKQQTKTMTMDWQQILKEAERVYQPQKGTW
ncbi:MAG: penicillin acylase family protein [Chitinophagales bacterium]|nr:penicillin acylase family protein [Chitinophagales bacterium]